MDTTSNPSEGSADLHPVLSLLSAFFWVVLWLLSWVKFAVAFVTITIPRLVYATLSYSLTLTLNFWSFAILLVAGAIALNYWIRARYLNVYAHLKEPPLKKENAQELHPDVNTPEGAPGFHNYLDEFLQAVRVFGFLEKPVFHELARHLQTRRLVAGDSISLDQDKSFYCVVDGCVQVFAQTGEAVAGEGTSWDEEDMNGYRLLNEVGSGGTLSSLFTILSLFTEDVKISWQDDETIETDVDTDILPPSVESVRTRLKRVNSDVSRFDLDVVSPEPMSRRASASSTSSTVHGHDQTPTLTQARSPASDRRILSPSSTPVMARSPLPQHSSFSSARMSIPSAQPTPLFDSMTPQQQGTVARASEDSTLAVIPAEAFRRLTKKFPKATAHIVQVILTRLSRVTFTAAHEYLGLTTEVLRTEKAINDIACHPLPPSFYEGGGLRYLRERFDRDATAASSDAESDYFSYASSRKSSSSKSSQKKDGRNMSIDSPHKRGVTGSSTDTVHKPSPPPSTGLPTPFAKSQSSRKLVQAGDLHSSMGSTSELYRPINRSILNTPRVPRPFTVLEEHAAHDAPRLSGDDFDVRDEVMACIAKSIGLLQPPLSGEDSVEASPAVTATDGRPKMTSFSNSFGSLSLLDIGDDMSSMTGGSSIATNVSMSGLDNEIEILYFAAGTPLVRAGERNTGLFYVIDGFLDISIPPPDPSKLAPDGIKIPKTDAERPGQTRFAPFGPSRRDDDQSGRKALFTVKPGGIAGYLSSLCNIESYVDIVAKTDAYVGFLPSHALDRLLEKRPIVLLTLAKRLISLLSPLVKHIDSSLDWMQVDAGQVLWRPEEASDSFYIVINGRLRAISEGKDGVAIKGEYGQGDTVGELDVITSSPRRNTVHAIRDTELIRMPQTLFNAISSRHPQTTARILRMIATRVRSEVDSASRNSLEQSRATTNLKTVAIIPSRAQIPVDAFARKLHAALEAMGAPTAYLNQASVSDHLGRHAFTRMGKLKTAGWLADQEQRYRIVLYVADSTVSSPWTQTCIRQADCVMVLGMGDDPSQGEYERLLFGVKTTARKELILLHPDRSVPPGSTREWLKSRPWVHQHIHVELPGLVARSAKVAPMPDDLAAVAALKNLKDRVQNEIQKYRGGHSDTRRQRPPHSNDFARLARRICGKSVGLVLGGGGARGLSHLGVIRALEDYGVPIDHIGGTSIGGFIGGLYAQEGDIITSSGRAKQFSGRMSNIWRILSDVTYPIVAYTTGHEFNRSIYKAFYDLHIEDMWLPFFTNTSNINTSRMEIHETGYAWRFIRASMTLAGLLPPLCDNGSMLVDGGYMDNLPVSAMFAMGASAVFASDVGSLDDNSPRNFGDYVSGWWLLINRWNPFSNTRGIPAITEIQTRLAYISSIRTLEEAKATAGCMYMQMPVHEYGTLQFGMFEEIKNKGYDAALKMLEKWEEEGALPSISLDDDTTAQRGKKKGRSARRNSI